MPEHLVTLETLSQVHNAVGGSVQIGVVDLVRVTGQDDLGAHPGPGNDGLDLVWGKVLGLVHDHELLGD